MCDNQAFTLPPVYTSHDFFDIEEQQAASAAPPYNNSATNTREPISANNTQDIDQRQQYDQGGYDHPTNAQARSYPLLKPRQLQAHPYDSDTSYIDPYFQPQPRPHENRADFRDPRSQPHPYWIVTDQRYATPQLIPYSYDDPFDPEEEYYEARNFRYDDNGRLIELKSSSTTLDRPLPPINNHQSSMINHQSSIINHQSSTINHQPSIIIATNVQMLVPFKSYRKTTMLAAVVMCCFCWPLGLVALLYAKRARTTTDPVEAGRYARTATTLSILGLIIGIISITVGVYFNIGRLTTKSNKGN